MGSTAGNDQNTLSYDFMQKFGIKMRKKHAMRLEIFKWLAKQENILDGFYMQEKFRDRDSAMCV